MIGRLSERLDGVAERSLPFLVGFLVLLPFAIAAIRILSWDSGSPLGDWAALDLDVRSGPAFLGSYSQYGFRHPGPLFIWWMSWPRLIASGSAAYLVGMTALAAVAACLGVWIAWRAWGRRVGFAVAMSFVLLAPLTGWSYVTSPWNPMVGLLGLPLLVVVAAAAWDRDVVSSVAAVAVASFLIQAHVGNVGTCMAILTVLALGQLRTDARSDLRKAWGAAAGTALLLWLVPGVQQLVSGRAGNVWKIMRFSRNGPIPKTGFGDAIQAGMRAFRPRPAWLGATNVYEGVADHGRPLWLLAPLGVGMVLLWDRYAGGTSTGEGGGALGVEGNGRIGERVARRLLGIAIVGWLGAVVMLGQGRGPVRAYYTVHIESLAAVIVASSVSYLALRGLRLSRGRDGDWAVGFHPWNLGRLVPVVALAGVVVFASMRTGSLEPQGERSDSFSRPVEVIKDSAETALGPRGRVVVSQSSPGGVSNEEFSFAMGFVAALNRSGVDVSVGLEVDPTSGDPTIQGLQLAVPESLWVDAPGSGDLAVVLFSGEKREVPKQWRVVSSLPNGTLVTLRNE